MAGEEISFEKARVLVVDDEPNIAALMQATLAGEAIGAATAISGQDALLQLATEDFDAIVLDINLPDVDGFELIRRIRERGFAQPVLFVTARENTSDRVGGLSLGAEDYIVKPFDLDEFVARVKVCLRRLPKFAHQSRARVGSLEIDLNSHQAWRAGKEISLTPTEFSLLSALVRRAGAVVSRQELLNEVWFDGFRGSPTLLDPFISHLRKKIDADSPHLIHTVRGVGYTLRADS